MRKKEKFRTVRHKHEKKRKTVPSLREPVIARALTNRMGISEDILLHAPIVTGYGKHRFCIENYCNIIEYTQSCIRIKTQTGKIHVIGKNLVIAYFRDDAMCVVGDILSIEYQ